MQVEVKGKAYNLKDLTDPQYARAKKLRRKDPPLDECPTCDGKRKEIEGSGGVTKFVTGTYRNMHGEEIVCDCKTQMALRARYLIANIGEQYMRLDWDTFEPEGVKRDIDNYIENRENFLHLGIGLEFGGPLGVGKTFAATYIGREMVKRNQSVYFTRFKDMAFSFEEKDGDVDELCRDSTYLIIDELQVSHSSAQASVFSDRFEAMIRHRTDFDLPTIITTNVSEEALEEAYPRVYSLLAAKQLRLEFEGDDVRKSKMNKENLEMAMNGEKRPIT